MVLRPKKVTVMIKVGASHCSGGGGCKRDRPTGGITTS